MANERYGAVTFKGIPQTVIGAPLKVGDTFPEVTLTATDLGQVNLASYKGQVCLLSVVPSLDTGICDAQTRRFDSEAETLGPSVRVITVSADLPFAQGRFCTAEKLNHIVTLSTFRTPSFGRDYGVRIRDSALAGLMSRAVLVLDASNTVVYAEQVPEIAQEPDYARALAAVRGIS